jgi:hypothetical protein
VEVDVGLSPSTLPLALDPTRPHIPLPGRWTFWAETMVGGQRLGMVDVSSFYCVKRLNAWGYGNVTVNLPCGLDTDTMLTLWSWRLWSFYDGSPVWCGVPTGLADQNGSAHVQFTLVELPGYLQRRQWDRVRSDLDWNWPPILGGPGGWFRGVEQCTIARELADPVQDVGVQIVTEPGPGFLRDRRYEYLEGGSRGQLLVNLAGVLWGPEFRTEYRMAANDRPVCTLRIAYPRVGSDDAGLGVSVPGAVLSYRAQFDSDQLRTRTFAVGDLPEDAHSGEGPPPPRPVVVAELTNPRLPRLDAVDDWPGTILVDTLRQRAMTAQTINSVPAQTITGSPPESYPVITSYGPGDTVTVRAVTPLIPDGIEFAARLQEVEINAGEGTATWSLSLLQPPQGTRETVAGRLVRNDRTIAALFHSGAMRPV